MMKRIISLVLCLGLIAGTFLMAGCEANDTTTSTDDALPMTLNFVGITEDTTTPEAIDATEEALNRIFKTQFKTKIELTLVTADEYIELIESRVAEAEQAKTKLEAISKYNSMAQQIANQIQRAQSDSSNKKGGLFSKWTSGQKTVEASTLSTGSVYTAEETTIYEDGTIETVYPVATSPIDILMIDGKEMYDYLDEKGYLLSVADKLTTEFTRFKQYIYPTFFDQLQTITDDIKAIPNNNLLAEYTYLVVDKALADKYDFDVETVDSFDDLDVGGAGFLSQVSAGENVTVLASEPDALGIYKYFEGDIAVGTYYHPIYGYSTAERTDFTVRNLFDIPQYTDHLVLMETYRNNGYFTEKSENFAVNVIKGDASLPEEYADDYYVKVLQNPFVEMDAIFDGMLAVSSYTADETRALQILEAINTNPEVKNILQYGIAFDGENDEVANYRLNEVENEDGTVSLSITRINNTYMMDNALTGNVYMGYPEEGQSIDAWDYYKKTNLDSALSPFMYFYVGESDLDAMLTEVIRRACLTEAFKDLGFTYDEYENTNGTTQGNTMRREFKAAYIEFFIDCLTEESSIKTSPLNFVIKGAGSALEQDFMKFVLSKEGQAALKKAGYATVDENAAPYTASGASGKLTLIANTGTTYIGYITNAMTFIKEAYEAANPAVTVVLPTRDVTKGYTGDLLSVNGTSVNVGLSDRDLTAAEKNSNLKATAAGISYLDIFNNDNHETYRIGWYEGKMIDKISAERYSNIVSASGLDALAKNKVASLAGVDLSKIAAASRPASESIVLANAKNTAANYYTNIKYLRVMADELLLTPEESKQFAGLADVDYEKAIFDFVKANYEKDNNLTEEQYVKLVQDFMASVLEYTSAEDSTSKYTVSWDEFQNTKASAQTYMEAATKLKDAYYDKIISSKVIASSAAMSKALLATYSLPEIVDVIYDVMYLEYLEANGLDRKEFEAGIKDIYLSEVGSSADELASYAQTSDEYKNTVNNLRKEYKKLLIEIYGKAVYDKGENGVSNKELLQTLFDHFLEEEVKINDQICEIIGLDYETFSASEVHMTNYDMYIGTMKTMFVYTLRTKYTAAQIDAWTYEETETNLYNILYEDGFYTNELAKYIGLSLSNYMLAKSNAVTYQTYIQNLVNALAPELQAMGYNTTELVKADGTMIEDICKEIVIKKYFSDKVSIQDVMIEASAKYMQGIENATDMAAYLAEAKEATNNSHFYMAVINSLQQAWVEQKGEIS